MVERTADLLYRRKGCSIWATTNHEEALMEWEDPDAGRLAHLLTDTLRRHAVSTNLREHLGGALLLVRRLAPLPIEAVVHGSHNDAAVRYVDADGHPLHQVEGRVPAGLCSSCLDFMEDTATHAARSLRAHLTVAGIDDLELRLTFGTGPAGEYLLEVINPLMCRLGASDFGTVYTRLGGRRS